MSWHRVYHALGRDEKARFHFRASLADRLPSSVKDAVDAYLNSIDARKRWAASFSMSVLPESNPAKRTDAREVRIGGVPFRLNDDARAASGIGLFLNAGGQYSPVIGEDWRGVLALSTAGKIYRNDDWNDISIQGDLGIARLFDRGEAAGGIRLTRRWLGGENYSTGIGPWARGRMRLSPSVRVDAFLGAERRRHPDRSGMDGWIFSLRSGLDYGFSARTSLRMEFDLERNGARDKHHASRLAGLAFALSHAFEGGLSVSPRLSLSLRRHDGADPLFQKKRVDRIARVLRHRASQGPAVSRFRPVYRLCLRNEPFQHSDQHLHQSRRCLRHFEDILKPYRCWPAPISPSRSAKPLRRLLGAHVGGVDAGDLDRLFHGVAAEGLAKLLV